MTIKEIKIQKQIDQIDIIIDKTADTILINGNSLSLQASITSLLKRRETLKNSLWNSTNKR